MRKVSTYLSAATIGLLLMASCSSDDNTPDQEPIEENHLLGQWDLNTADIKLYVNGELQQEMNDVSTEEIGAVQFDFKEDGTVDYVFSDEEGSESSTGTYQKNGDNLTITIDNDPQTFEIHLNNSNNLHLFLEEEETYQEMLLKTEVTFKFVKM